MPRGNGDLPLGWERSRTPDGRVYYIDHNTKRTSWVPPPRVASATARLEEQRRAIHKQELELKKQEQELKDAIRRAAQQQQQKQKIVNQARQAVVQRMKRNAIPKYVPKATQSSKEVGLYALDTNPILLGPLLSSVDAHLLSL